MAQWEILTHVTLQTGVRYPEPSKEFCWHLILFWTAHCRAPGPGLGNLFPFASCAKQKNKYIHIHTIFPIHTIHADTYRYTLYTQYKLSIHIHAIQVYTSNTYNTHIFIQYTEIHTIHTHTYICMYVHVCVCIGMYYLYYVGMCTNEYVYDSISVYMHVFASMCLNLCVCACICMYLLVCA